MPLGDTDISLPNSNFSWDGVVFSGSQNSKCQGLANFSFSGGGSGYSWIIKTQSVKFWLTFHWGGGGWGVFLGSQSSKCQVLARERGKGSYSRIGYSWLNEQNFCHAMPYSGSPCITDSFSHTTCVETKKLLSVEKNQERVVCNARYT